MAISKNYTIRERVLDRYLSSGKWYTRQQLEDFCNKALVEQGEQPVTSRTTLHNDLTTISNKYKVAIATKRQGKQIFYKYNKMGFSIYNSELSEQDYSHLMEALEVLRRFKGMPQFDWVNELYVRFNYSFRGKDSQRAYVGFQDSTRNTGMEYFTPLFDAIRNRVTLNVTYHSFKRPEPKSFVISPYYLKEYNKRWFLLGKTPGYMRISTFALDRIVKIENAGIAYEETDIDFEQRFKDVIGMTVSEDAKRQIDIFFSKDQLNYVLTKPLHPSQQLVSRNDEGAVLRYELIPNYEMEQAILSFGDKAVVLSPADIREQIKARIVNSAKNY